VSAARPAPRLLIGLMSGTSLDGVDAVLAHFPAASPPVLRHALHLGFPADLRDELLALTQPGDDEIERAGRAANRLSRFYAEAVTQLLAAAKLAPEAVSAIGAHGQTVRHRPEAGFSVQLGAPALLAELTGIAVVADFRARDLAAGGQGAPLVPAFHAAAFGTEHPRAVVNIGGIANLSFLPARGAPGAVVRGFDCGPGNLLLDAWIQREQGAAYDHDGAWGAAGRVDQALLARLLADPYFELDPPKSTGREHFKIDWLESRLKGAELAQDVQASLVALTAATIAQAIDRWAPECRDVLVCGGGARNAALMRELAARCAGRPVVGTQAHGIAPEHVEALAFAWLAHAHLEGKTGNLPEVTGARGARVLGALYPA
jgi:anhydro-N-acetylmuramic acid kinase